MSLLKQNDNDTQTMIDELKVEVDADRISKCGHLLKKKPPRTINLFEANFAYYTVTINDMIISINNPRNRPDIKLKYDLEGVYDHFMNIMENMRGKYKNNNSQGLSQRFSELGIQIKKNDLVCNNVLNGNNSFNGNNNIFGSGFNSNTSYFNPDYAFRDLLKINIGKREFFSNIKIHYKLSNGNEFGDSGKLHRSFKTELIKQRLYDFKEQWNYYVECLASQYKPDELYHSRHIKFKEAKRAQWIYDACHGKKPEVIEILDDNEETPKIVQETVVDQKIRRENFLNDSYKFSKSPLFSQKIFN